MGYTSSVKLSVTKIPEVPYATLTNLFASRIAHSLIVKINNVRGYVIEI